MAQFQSDWIEWTSVSTSCYISVRFRSGLWMAHLNPSICFDLNPSTSIHLTPFIFPLTLTIFPSFLMQGISFLPNVTLWKLGQQCLFRSHLTRATFFHICFHPNLTCAKLPRIRKTFFQKSLLFPPEYWRLNWSFLTFSSASFPLCRHLNADSRAGTPRPLQSL